MSSIIRTSGCIISVDTKKDETHCFGAFRSLSRAKRKGRGEVIEGRDIVVEGKEIDNQPQGKMKN